MNIANVIRGERGFEITWEDWSATEFPFIWLRDNDPGELHPDTRERVFDLMLELNREYASSLVVVTHDLTLAGKMDRILELADGRLNERSG